MSAAYYDDVQQIYVAYYGRPADPAGQASWAAILAANNGDLKAIINAFGTSAESTALYAGTTSAAKITAIYNQLFNRAPDSAGLAFYTAELDAKRMTASSIALNIADGAKGVDATYLSNKLTVADAFTAALTADSSAAAAYTLSTAGTARSLLSGVTTSAATTNVNAAVAAIKAGGGASSVTGTIYTLTTDSDMVQGGANADWIRAVVAADANGDKVSTLGDDDYLDGGAGHDKLTISFTESADTNLASFAGTATDIEEIEVVTSGSTTVALDLTGASLDGLETITISKNKANDVAVSVADLTDIGVRLNGAGTGAIALSATSSNSATLSVEVLNSSAGTTGIDFTFTGADDVTALELAVVGDATFAVLDAGTLIETITVTGCGDLDLTAATALTALSALTSVDASGLAGGLAAEFTSGDLVEVLGGAGDDDITLDVGTAALVADLGEGDDALDISAAADTEVAGYELDGGAGLDTVTVAGTTDVVTELLDVVTGFERVALTAASLTLSWADLDDAGITAVGLADDGALTLDDVNGANVFVDPSASTLTLNGVTGSKGKNDSVVIDVSSASTTAATVVITTDAIEDITLNITAGGTSADVQVTDVDITGAKALTVNIAATADVDGSAASLDFAAASAIDEVTFNVSADDVTITDAALTGTTTLVIDVTGDNFSMTGLTSEAEDVTISLGGDTNVITSASLSVVEQLTIDTAGADNAISALTAAALVDLTINITDGDFTMSADSLDLLETLTITGSGDLTALTLATSGTESVLTEVDLSDFTGELVSLDLSGMANTDGMTITFGDIGGDTAALTVDANSQVDTFVFTTDGNITYEIDGFEAGNDILDLSAFNVAWADINRSDDGVDTEITIDDLDITIVLVGVTDFTTVIQGQFEF